MWIFQAALYGVLKGGRDVMKKLALEKSSTLEVLFFYTFKYKSLYLGLYDV